MTSPFAASVAILRAVILRRLCRTIAAELKVISAGAVRSMVGGMIEDYSRRTRMKLNFRDGQTGLLRDTIASGGACRSHYGLGAADGGAEKTRKMMPGGRVDLGRLGFGLVTRWRPGARHLDARGACKQALIKARDRSPTPNPKLGGTLVLHPDEVSGPKWASRTES